MFENFFGGGEKHKQKTDEEVREEIKVNRAAAKLTSPEENIFSFEKRKDDKNDFPTLTEDERLEKIKIRRAEIQAKAMATVYKLTPDFAGVKNKEAGKKDFSPDAKEVREERSAAEQEWINGNVKTDDKPEINTVEWENVTLEDAVKAKNEWLKRD